MCAKKQEKDSADFERLLQRLETIVSELERGELALDKAIELFEEGKALGKRCGKQLTELDKRVLKIIEQPDEKYRLEPFEAPAEEQP